jgi:hypothetical protein
MILVSRRRVCEPLENRRGECRLFVEWKRDGSSRNRSHTNASIRESPLVHTRTLEPPLFHVRSFQLACLVLL